MLAVASLSNAVFQRQEEEHRERTMNDDVTQRSVEVTVTPRHLLPDTNCFVNHLQAISRILASQKFVVVVPLIVITELDGLSKGIGSLGTISQTVTSPAEMEHYAHVARMAAESVAMLEAEFEKRNRMLVAVTSQGHLRDSITFRSEETGEGVRRGLLYFLMR